MLNKNNQQIRATESADNFAARLTDVKSQLRQHDGERILVITHSRVIKDLLVNDVEANNQLPSKERVTVLNSSLWPYNFNYLV